MFDLKSNKTLGIILLALAVIVLIIFLGGGNKKERTFRKELVDIDTSAVSDILLYPKSKGHKEVRLYKEDGNWKVSLPGGKSASVPKNKVDNLLKALQGIKPTRLAARSETKWAEFQVDTTSTRVRVLEDGDETLNIIIGKFAFQQPRQMNTYVRLAHDTDVYEVEGFLGMTFDRDADSFRDNYILNESQKDWKSLKFDYPADSSFYLANVNGVWSVNGRKADSAETVKYLRSIARLSNSHFIDNVDSSMLQNPVYKLTIERGDSTFRTISAFKSDSTWVVNSSSNPESYFDGKKNGLLNKIFIGSKKLMKK